MQQTTASCFDCCCGGTRGFVSAAVALLLLVQLPVLLLQQLGFVGL
jgi:hypothetical protein